MSGGSADSRRRFSNYAALTCVRLSH